MNEIIHSSLTLLGGIIAGLVASYLATKGKLWAERETLPKLTQQLELIKSQIGVLTNQHNVLFVEEKETLILFNSHYDNWFSTLQVAMPGKIHQFQERIFDQFADESNRTYDQLRASRNRLELFIEDSVIVEKAQELVKKTYEQKKFVDRLFYEINQLRQKFFELQYEYDINSLDYSSAVTSEIDNPYIDLILEYRKFVIGQNKLLTPLRTEFHKICRDYIRKNLNSNH